MIELCTDTIVKEFRNRKIEIQFKELEIAKADILPFLNKAEFNSYCIKGCPNHNEKWTCPPNCPDFEIYAQPFSKIKLFLFFSATKQFHFLSEENRSLESYNFIKEELQYFLREQEGTEGKMIAANSCEICSPCALNKGKKCYFPGKIRYNLVAFGFNVGKIMTDLFQHELKWAKENKIPEYVSSVGAILK
ncbi:DUF2284 domain-containing protein [Marinifilum caeruleilacunae]|nr:DUF2284 domain-containing protein [Marinifilum caeruleilacunae]